MINRSLFKNLLSIGLVLLFLGACQPLTSENLKVTSSSSQTPDLIQNEKDLVDICQEISTEYAKVTSASSQENIVPSYSPLKKSLGELPKIIANNNLSSLPQTEFLIKEINSLISQIENKSQEQPPEEQDNQTSSGKKASVPEKNKLENSPGINKSSLQDRLNRKMNALRSSCLQLSTQDLQNQLTELQGKQTLYNIILFIVSLALIYALWRGNRTTSQSAQNRENENSEKTSFIESLVNSVEFQKPSKKVEEPNRKLEKLSPTVEQKRSDDNCQNNSQSHTIQDPVRQSVHVPISRSQEPQKNNLIEAYNSNPDSLGKNAIKVSEKLDSMNQRRLGSHPKIVFEKVRRGKENYWIIQSSGTNNYLVPKKGIKINEHNYETLAALFVCNNYRSGNTHFQLLKPAKVVTLAQGETWELIEPGELRF